MKTITTLFLIALIMIASGCVHTEIELKDGSRFSRTSFLSNQTVGDVDVNMDGPQKGVRIKSYGQNGTDVAAKALETAAAALRKAP